MTKQVLFLLLVFLKSVEAQFSSLNLQGLTDLVIDLDPPAPEEIEALEGETGPNVVIEKVVAYPGSGDVDQVVLRNMGGQTADLTGWTLFDNKKDPILLFGEPGCEGNATIPPQEKLVLLQFDDFNPCGIPFGISFRDTISLQDEKEAVVAQVVWTNSTKGYALRLISSDYIQIPEEETLVTVLESIPQFSTFVEALKAQRFDRLLGSDVNPEFAGIPIPSPPSPSYNIEFPWWFGFAIDKSTISPPPPPPPPPPSPPLGEIPKLGPYTILAPTNEAFDDLLLLLGGGRVRVPLQAFLRLPELEDILLYHIMYGDYTTEFMFNNTGITTTLGPEVVVSKDPRWSEGLIALNDACVDKPTTGFPCAQQLEFDKCYEPFMISPLAAGWQGGFCQKTCMRCSCDPDVGSSCATIQYPDILAANGVVHGISRVLFPPPIFGDIQEEAVVPLPEEEIVSIVATQVGTLPQLPSLPGLPGLS